MKITILSIFILMCSICQAQSDNYADTVGSSILWKHYEDDSMKVNYHIFDHVDTVFFNMEKVELDLKLGGVTNHIDCYDVPTSIEKGHNWCQILKDSIPFSGYVKQRILKKDSTVKIFSGILSEGYIMNGSYIEFYYNGKIKQTGQYENNWKVGIWTSYYENGQIEWLGKYIEKNDYPVVEFEYKNNGELEYFNDEEKFMKNLIDKEDAEK